MREERKEPLELRAHSLFFPAAESMSTLFVFNKCTQLHCYVNCANQLTN